MFLNLRLHLTRWSSSLHNCCNHCILKRLLWPSLSHCKKHNINTWGGPFYSIGLTLTPLWMNNYIYYKAWGKIPYPFPKLHRWSLGTDKSFHPTLYWAWDYSSMLGLKLNRVIKRGPDVFIIACVDKLDECWSAPKRCWLWCFCLECTL